MKTFFAFVLIFAASLRAEDAKPSAVVPAATPAPVAAEPKPALTTLLDKETVAALATVPVQEAGRLKPFDTLARYRLLRFSGKRTIAFENPETKKKQYLSAMELMLVTWLRPDLAKDMPVFVVDNSDVVVELGLSAEKKGKRDRYSYNELQAGRDTLLQKRQEYQEIDAKKRTAVQTMIGNLGSNLLDYEMLLTHFDFVRKPVGGDLKIVPAEIKTDAVPLRLSKLLPEVLAYVQQNPPPRGPEMKRQWMMTHPWMMDVLRGALGGMMSGNPELSLRSFPPPTGVVDVWNGPGWIVMDNLQAAMDGQAGKAPTAADLVWLAAYEDLYLNAMDPAKFKASVLSLASKIKAAAAERGEGKYVALEEHYLHAEYFYYALISFFLGLIVLAVNWASPEAGWARRARQFSTLCLMLGTGLSVTGIVIRCIIMQRPPITTLYETIIFITAACALFGLVAELITRKGLGLLIAAVAGTAGLFLSIRFETMEGQDTMQQLQAVLITNFWLATHVPMVNLGYAAAMVAAILSQAYIVRRLIEQMKNLSPLILAVLMVACGVIAVGIYTSCGGAISTLSIMPKILFGVLAQYFCIIVFCLIARLCGAAAGIRAGDENARNLTRMAYGFVCAGVFLSLVGTILGGIWANYSWGRFWGWDPKENGALMIVIMCLVILHARLGGYIKEIGMHVCCTILGMIVAFSWFGVNNLGVGLHAYGFTDGLWFWLSAYWGLQCLFILQAGMLKLSDHAATRKAKPAEVNGASAEAV